MGDNGAILAGFTKEVMASAAGCDLHLFVKPDADLDDRFLAWDADVCEWVTVNGCLFTFEDCAVIG